jgi:hypothetical protein
MKLAGEVVADAGAVAIPFQLIIGGVLSGLALLFALLAGRVLDIALINRRWNGSVFLAIGLLALGATPFFVQGLEHPALIYGGLFVAVFAVLQWPPRRIR